MPKMKTAKGVTSRFKVTARGKVIGFRAGRRHLLGTKRAKTKRQMRRRRVISKLETARLRALMPYS